MLSALPFSYVRGDYEKKSIIRSAEGDAEVGLQLTKLLLYDIIS